MNIGVMWLSRRRWGELEARVSQLELSHERDTRELRALVDAPELERMRGSVLNALRALRRSQEAQEARENGKGSKAGDDYDRQLAIRRGGQRGVL